MTNGKWKALGTTLILQAPPPPTETAAGLHLPGHVAALMREETEGHAPVFKVIDAGPQCVRGIKKGMGVSVLIESLSLTRVVQNEEWVNRQETATQNLCELEKKRMLYVIDEKHVLAVYEAPEESH